MDLHQSSSGKKSYFSFTFKFKFDVFITVLVKLGYKKEESLSKPRHGWLIIL